MDQKDRFSEQCNCSGVRPAASTVSCRRRRLLLRKRKLHGRRRRGKTAGACVAALAPSHVNPRPPPRGLDGRSHGTSRDGGGQSAMAPRELSRRFRPPSLPCRGPPSSSIARSERPCRNGFLLADRSRGSLHLFFFFFLIVMIILHF